MELLFDGNGKRVYSTEDPSRIKIAYKDVISAYGGVKRARFEGIGSIRNRISAILMEVLEKNGIRTHFLSLLSDSEQLCLKLEHIPIEVTVHNVLAGTLARRYDVPEGTRPGNIVVDMRYKRPELGKPSVNADQAVALGIVSYEEFAVIDSLARKANEVLTDLFKSKGLELVDFKLEFGRLPDGTLIVCDELSPDRSRLWDIGTGERYDKDRFRHDLGNVRQGYEHILERLEN